MSRIEHPIDNAPVYICGEAWSTQQGWVEGALQTADHVLEDHLGIKPWVPERTEQHHREQAERVWRSLPA
jgi:monoamine oxidase